MLKQFIQNNYIKMWHVYTPDHLLLDRSPKIGPLITRWELDKFKDYSKKNCGTSKILTLLYQQFLNLFISQRNMSGPRLRALSNNRWSRVTPDHIFLDSAPNLGPLISRWEINKIENCWYKSVQTLEVLKLLFQQFLNLLNFIPNEIWVVQY